MTDPPEGAHSTVPAPVPSRAQRLLQPLRSRNARISLAVFVVTFLLYFLLGPLRTPYDFQVSQANNMLHGHLDMTEEYTNNLHLLERVLYDGEGFCLPIDDPRGPERAEDIENPRFSADCRHYMVHGFGPSIMLLPLVALFGLSVNQALISALFGAATAVIVLAITRRFVTGLGTQLGLTVGVVFGTTLWFSSADGSVWHFALATAAFFSFASIYAAVVLRNPLLAGALIGAAFLCRPTTVLAGFFPLVALSDLWLPPGDRPLLRRLHLRPLVLLALGVAPFIALGMVINYARFDSPFETGYTYIEEFHQISLAWLLPAFSVDNIGRHVAVFFEQGPVFATTGSFIWPAWGGQALWLTSPVLLLGLFVHLRHQRRPTQVAALALVVAGTAIVLIGAAQRLGWTTFSIHDVPLALHLLPFWLLIGLAVPLALVRQDRLVLACWAAIVPLVLANWLFTGTGWAQFGYRFALDFIPFLFLLVVLAVPRLRWYHVALIGASVVVNLWGMLWIHKFAPANLFGWTWVSF